MDLSSPVILQRAPSTVAPSETSQDVYIDDESKRIESCNLQSEVYFDVKPFSEATKANKRISSMVEQVMLIGESAFWGNNCLIDCKSRHGWRLNIIAEPRNAGEEVFGFLVYKIDSLTKVLHIQYIAVAERHRRKGIGSKLIKSLKKYAQETLTYSTIERIACACLPEAVEFYQSHQFRKGKRIVAGDEEACGKVLADGSREVQVPLQFHMEWKMPRRRSRAKILERGYLPQVSSTFSRSASSYETNPSRLASPKNLASQNLKSTRSSLDPFSLSWHNMSLVLNGESVLCNASGRLQSGTVTAMVSSDPAGAVALMETLSDRGYASRYKHLYKLEVRVNEKLVDTHQYSFRKRVAYLPTGDAILPVKSSVKEALSFHARMSRMSEKTSGRIVNKIITNLQLEAQQEKIMSELTLTEKARARVAIALVSRPAALLLDSPLLALDVYEAFQTVAVLKQVAKDLNIAVLISVDQPSSEVLFALDEVVFLSKGFVIFSGPPHGIVDYFYQLGYACPPSYSPSDFLLFLFEVVPEEEHNRLSSSWLWHVGNETVDTRMMMLPSVEEGAPPWLHAAQPEPLSRLQNPQIEEEDLDDDDEEGKQAIVSGGFFGDSKSGSHRAGFYLQFRLLFTRELKFLRRNTETLLVRLLLLVVLCVMVSLMMYRIGSNAQQSLSSEPQSEGEQDVLTHVNNYYGAIAVMVILAIFGQVEGVSVTIPAVRLLFMAEHSFADFYGSLAFFTSQLLVELPLTFINATIQVCVLYWTVGFDGNFIDWVALVFATAVATSSVGWLISSLTSSPLTALRLIPIVLLPQLLFSGLLTDVDLIPSWLNWMEYLCYLKYCINIAFLVEMQQYLSMNPVPEAVQSLADQNSIDREQITLYVGIVIVIIVLCRLVAALALYRYRTTQYLKL